jgi:hypothetical protein
MQTSVTVHLANMNTWKHAKIHLMHVKTIYIYEFTCKNVTVFVIKSKN